MKTNPKCNSSCQTWITSYLYSLETGDRWWRKDSGLPRTRRENWQWRCVNLSSFSLGEGPIHGSRRGGLTVSAMDSELRGLSSRAYRVIVLYSWAKKNLSSQCLSPHRSINEFKWTVRENWRMPHGGEGGTTFDGLTSHPGGCNNTPSHFMLEGPG